jgi:hypothetical protein
MMTEKVEQGVLIDRAISNLSGNLLNTIAACSRTMLISASSEA